MAQLTYAQEQRLRELLSRATAREQSNALQSVQSFLAFVQSRAYDIWQSLRNVLASIWDEIKSLFS